jgi:hypothetical protein
LAWKYRTHHELKQIQITTKVMVICQNKGRVAFKYHKLGRAKTKAKKTISLEMYNLIAVSIFDLSIQVSPSALKNKDLDFLYPNTSFILHETNIKRKN